jgi:hypothetical protein
MTVCNELADYEWLTGPEAAELAANAAASNGPLHKTIDQLRQRVSPGRAARIMDLVAARERAAAKFPAADRMFFTQTALAQATDEWVARYKASRFPAGELTADLCCGIGGDLLALTNRGLVIGVDCDPTMAHLAAANARVVLPPDIASRVTIRVAEVKPNTVEGVAAWHIDPDRRASGKRTTSIEWSSPNETVVESMLSACPHAAIKLAPGATLPDPWEAGCELEWISRDGECRQLVAWHGNLATATGKRRATMLSSASAELVARTFVGRPNESVPVASKPERFVFDCDPAVLAAHLKGALAVEHGLSALSASATYLTGPTLIQDSALSPFDVMEVLPFRAATIAGHLRALDIGQLEIKKRGVDFDPENFRRSLKLQGDRAAALLVTNLCGKPAAILAKRISSSIKTGALPSPLLKR